MICNVCLFSRKNNSTYLRQSLLCFGFYAFGFGFSFSFWGVGFRFFTYNILSKSDWLQHMIPSQLLRNAGIGLTASIVSDTMVNAVRVVKTTKQAIGSKHDVSYMETIRMILAADGWKGLFGRGLQARILTNALQSIVFTIIWRGLAERWSSSKQTSTDTSTTSRRRELERTEGEDLDTDTDDLTDDEERDDYDDSGDDEQEE